MRFMFVGDVVGRPGRNAVVELVPELRQSLRLDAVVVNCENAARGRGVTIEIAEAMLAAGVDVLTGGNHIWAFREIAGYMERQPRLVRPANYPNAPGRGAYRFALTDGRSLGVVQVEGRVFMRNLDCPFERAAEELEGLGECTATLLDVHCEATSEKQALGWHFDGKFSAVIGSHTHVQTADERVLTEGTAFLTDAGMTGPYDSVIGMRTDSAVKRFLTQRSEGHHVATDNVWLCGAVVETDDETGRAVSIERVKQEWYP